MLPEAQSPGDTAGAGAASIMSALTEKAVVRKELLDNVVGRDRYRVNNKHDGKYSPLPPSKIVQRAEELVGQELPYSLPCGNGEHFVTELRYGVACSDQISDVVKTIPAALLAATVFMRILRAGSKRKKQ
ncbi:phospholipase A and acyltransferase 2-like [Crocuta crocuta]